MTFDAFHVICACARGGSSCEPPLFGCKPEWSKLEDVIDDYDDDDYDYDFEESERRVRDTVGWKRSTGNVTLTHQAASKREQHLGNVNEPAGSLTVMSCRCMCAVSGHLHNWSAACEQCVGGADGTCPTEWSCNVGKAKTLGPVHESKLHVFVCFHLL